MLVDKDLANDILEVVRTIGEYSMRYGIALERNSYNETEKYKELVKARFDDLKSLLEKGFVE